jgi:hypothetical protein
VETEPQATAPHPDSTLDWWQWAFVLDWGVVLLGFGVSTGILWTRQPISLGKLRVIEVVVFGLALFHVAFMLYVDPLSGGLVGALRANGRNGPGPQNSFRSLLGNACLLRRATHSSGACPFLL